jgi:metal-dependent amidase/aminoacylase/carboxypeptidase family protein
MAGADIFVLTIDGKGGHAAMPHLTKDPVAAAGMCILALQTLISRQLDPFDQAVISLTKLEAGSAFNVIPATGKHWRHFANDECRNTLADDCRN